jgi:DNA invertase Pin-like site-specific DNA recombinase
MPIAYSYVRFSNKVQKKGHSEDRQDALRDAYLARHPEWQLDPLSLRDLGLSAFRGKNAMVGNLGLFLERVALGRVKPGSALIVESIDRLTRQGVDEGYDLCKKILKAGVHIITLTPERDFGPDAVKGLTRGALELQLILERAWEESQRKSERVREAWLDKKRRAREGLCQKATERMGTGRRHLTDQVPAWVEVRDGRLALVPCKAEAVRTIFRLAAAGYGGQRIVRKLIADGVPPLNGKPWDKSYVSKILRDGRAKGEFQPCGPGRKPEGDPVPGYFPAAVTQDEWVAARLGAKARQHARGPKGDVINLFARLVKDARDGGSYFMMARPNRTGHAPARGLHHVLQNLESAHGRAKCVSLDYGAFERAVLSCLREVDPAEVLGKDRAPDELSGLEAELEWVRLKAAELEAQLLNDVPAIARKLAELAAKEKELAKQLEVARHKALHPLEEVWEDAQGLLEALDGAPDLEDARLRLRAALRRAISEINLLVVPRGRVRLAAVQVNFSRDGRRNYLLYYRPAHSGFGGRRESHWWCRSFKEAGLPGGKDLRRPEHARELEAILAATDLEADE